MLRSTSLFLLIGIALIFVCEYLNKSIKLFYFPSRRIQPLAVFAAIGFLLLIPVQCSSVYIQIRNSDNQANLEIRQADRRISAFRAVPNLNQLRDMAKDIPPGWQYDGSVSFEDNRSRLISTSEDQLARLRIMASSGKSQAVQKAVPDLISQAIICLLYAQVFYKMRPIKKRLVFDIDTDDVKDSELFP